MSQFRNVKRQYANPHPAFNIKQADEYIDLRITNCRPQNQQNKRWIGWLKLLLRLQDLVYRQTVHFQEALCQHLECPLSAKHIYDFGKTVQVGLLNQILCKMLTLSSTTALECAPFSLRTSSSSNALNCSSMGTQSSSSRTSSST